jgi:hypothetical protein
MNSKNLFKLTNFSMARGQDSYGSYIIVFSFSVNGEEQTGDDGTSRQPFDQMT